MTRVAAIAGLVLFTVGCVAPVSASSSSETAPPLAPAQAAPEVTTIIAKVQDRYTNLKTYRDEGTYLEVFMDLAGAETHRSTGHFRTRWRAPGRMLVVVDHDASKYQSPKRLAVWTTESDATKTLFLGKVRDDESLDRALGAMTGVSKSITALVPTWLSRGGCRLQLKYELTGRTKCADAECYVLEVDRSLDAHVALEIDARTYAIRRYSRRNKLVPSPLSEDDLARLPESMREHLRERWRTDPPGPFLVDSEIVFTPTFDEPIADSELAFDPLLR